MHIETIQISAIVRFSQAFFRRAIHAALLTAMAVVLVACESPQEKAAGYLASAEQYFASEDLVKAEIEVKNALQIEPKNAQARFLMAQISESRGDYADMAQNLRIAIETDPEYIDARVKLGTLYSLGGAREEAKEQADYLAGTGVERADIHILRARIVAAEGDLEAAQQELEAALRLEPDNTQALGLLAGIAASTDIDRALQLVNQGIVVADDPKPLRVLKIELLKRSNRVDEADAEYKAVLRDYPDEIAFSYQYARFLAEQGKVDEAEPVLRDIVEMQPDNLQARAALIQFVGNTRGAEEAEALLREYVDAKPELYALRLTLAQLYQSSSRLDEALVEYDFLIDAVPNENEGLTAKSRKAGILLSRGEEEAGEALLEDVLLVDSANADALLIRGALRVDRKEFRKAVGDFRTLLRNDPENKRAQLLIARAHVAAGDSVLAKDAFRRVLVIDPQDATAPMELARILVQEDDKKGAERVIRERLTLEPADVRASRVLIALQVSAKKYPEAEAEARRIAALPGQKAIGDYLLGGVYQAQDKFDLAIRSFRSSLDEAPSAREPLQALVASLANQNRADEAERYLNKLIAENPENLYAKTLLGQLLAGTGDAVAAEAVLESALDSNESWLPAYTALASLQGGDVGAQISIYERGLEAMPANQEMALLLGTAYERTGRVDEAITAYERVLEAGEAAGEKLPAVANNLAALLADHRSDKASFERALELSEQFENSDNPAFLDTLGWVHYRLGNYSEAIPYLERAVDAASQVPVLRYHLGMAYKASNKPIGAKEELEAALADDSVKFTGIEEARAALAEL